MMSGTAIGNDAVLRTSLVWLAAIMLLIGFWTQSWKKMVATYWFGMFAICGVVLPDAKFFDRPVSQWGTVVTDDDGDRPNRSHLRYKFYPVRLFIYAAVYSFGFHKWWKFITS